LPLKVANTVLPHFLEGRNVTLKWYFTLSNTIQFYLPRREPLQVVQTQAICRVRTGPGKPGKSWNFNIPKSRPGNPGKTILVMETHGKLKFYITSTKYFTCFNLPVITVI
jgi:hypothetical protein